jgi:KDO2-lipid IV(A) lauroyltransferase
MRRALLNLGDRILGLAVVALLGLLRHTDPDRASAVCGRLARWVGPWLPAHRIGQQNLRAAFPDRDAAWIERTLRDAWENLGRVAGEYVHLGRLWDWDPARPNRGRIILDSVPILETLRDDGRPGILFGAHLANWELLAVGMHRFGLPAAVSYRMPNNERVAAELARIRTPLMGRLIRTRSRAGLEMAAVLQQGLHLGMLVDQHFSRGVDVTFFGRRCKANPAVARLARQFDCPVVGGRVVRLPGGRFRVVGEGPIALARDAGGQIDVAAATQQMMTMMEGWVRDNPGQYLWFHRRWR